MASEGQRWLSPAWEFLTRSLEPADWLRERYPELFAEGEPRRSMGQFDMLVCIRCGLIDRAPRDRVLRARQRYRR